MLHLPFLGTLLALAPLPHLHKLVLRLLGWFGLLLGRHDGLVLLKLFAVDGTGVLKVDLLGGGDQRLFHARLVVGVVLEVDPLRVGIEGLLQVVLHYITAQITAVGTDSGPAHGPPREKAHVSNRTATRVRLSSRGAWPAAGTTWLRHCRAPYPLSPVPVLIRLLSGVYVNGYECLAPPATLRDGPACP